MARAALILGLAATILLWGSALAHALLGWPPLGKALAEAAVDSETIGALSAGWHFGSMAFVVFGGIVLGNVSALRRGAPIQPWTLTCVAGGFLAFGGAAYVGRGFHPHFLAFIAFGLLLAAFAGIALLVPTRGGSRTKS